MDTLSVDVWQYIFALACTDGGRTGATLSRISKSFRSASAAARFHSVQLTSLKRVKAFLDCYEAALATAAADGVDPPHVRHLLLAFLPGQTDMFVLGPAFHFRDFHSWQEEKGPWNERFVVYFTELFTRIAPDLTTLTVLQNYEILLPYVKVAGGFPALRELTLVHEDRMFLRGPGSENSWMEPSDKEFYSAGPPPDKAALAASPIFPALEKLHLVDGEFNRTFPLWAAAAPRLVHLEISAARVETCTALRDTLLEDPKAFPSLRRIAVALAPLRPTRDSPAAPVADPAQAIHEVARLRPSVEVTFTPAPTAGTQQDWCGELSQGWTTLGARRRGYWQ